MCHAFLAVTSPIWVPTSLIYAQLIYSKLNICVVISSCDVMRSFIQFPSCILHVFLVVSTQGLPLLKSLAKKRTGPRKAPFFSGETSVE